MPAALAALTVALGAMSCAHNVPQDSATGNDGKEKGAKPIKLENGEGKAIGIVTYPGGDRIDWKSLELPDKQRGKLEIELSWTPPRPGLQLAFEVFNEWNEPVASSVKTAKKAAKGRLRTATVEDAHGKYSIRVYAVGRGDAGKYRLSIKFAENPPPIAVDPMAFQDPPKLAAVPDVDPTCDEFSFDMKNPACKAVCGPGAPATWPGCAGKCPTPPDINVPACLATMPCPATAPDRRIHACTKDKFPPCPDPAKPDPANPNCDGIKVPPVESKIIAKTVIGSEVIITIPVGSDRRVQPSWSGTVLRGKSGESPLAGGEITIVRVDKGQTVGKVRLTPDELLQNPRVRLSPP